MSLFCYNVLLTEHPSVSVTHREGIRTSAIVDSVHVADPGELTLSLIGVSDSQLIFHVSHQEVIQVFNGTTQETSLLRVHFIDANVIEQVASTRVTFRISKTRNAILRTNTQVAILTSVIRLQQSVLKLDELRNSISLVQSDLDLDLRRQFESSNHQLNQL